MYLYFFVKRIEIYMMRYKSSNLLLLLLFCVSCHAGHLAVPGDDNEYDFIQRIVRWSIPTASNYYWMGINDIEEEGKSCQCCC